MEAWRGQTGRQIAIRGRTFLDCNCSGAPVAGSVGSVVVGPVTEAQEAEHWMGLG